MTWRVLSREREEFVKTNTEVDQLALVLYSQPTNSTHKT